MQKNLNPYFNFPDEPEYYFYALNFGPFQQFQDFIRINYVTCLSGPNGSGKSSLMDAIKTCIIANQNYLSFNPKGGRETDLKDYLNLFYRKEKVGPTLLVFAVEFPTERKGYREAIFGIGWDTDSKGTMFYKENISPKNALPLIRNTLSTKDFLRKLEGITLPGKLHKWNNAVEYHRFLDEEGVFFFFPKDYEDHQSYRDFLRLLNDSTRALTSTERLKVKDLKKHLFRSHKDKKELEDSLNQIDAGLQLFYDYHTEREKHHRRLSSINHLLELYEDYYTSIEADKTSFQLLKYDVEISNLKINHQSLETRHSELETHVETLNKKIEEFNHTILVKESESNQFQKLIEQQDNCSEFYADNENIFNMDAQNLVVEISNIKRKIEGLEQSTRHASTQWKRYSTMLENSKKTLIELESKRIEQLKLKKSLTKELTDYRKQMKVFNEKKVRLTTQIRAYKSTRQDLDQLKLEIQQIGFQNDSELGDAINKLQREISDQKRSLEKLHKQISILKGSLEETKISPIRVINLIRNQYNLKQFYEYYEDCPIDILKHHESVFFDIKDFFVIPASRQHIFSSVLEATKEFNDSISFLVLKESDDLLATVKVEKEIDGKIIGKILDEQAAFYSPEIKAPRYFGYESRSKYLKKLENDEQKGLASIQDMNSQIDHYESLLTKFKVNSLHLKDISREIKTIVDKKSPRTVLKELRENINAHNKEIELILSHLGQIPSDEIYNENRAKLREDIDAYKKTLQSWQFDHKTKQEELKHFEHELIQKKKQQEAFPDIIHEGQQILSELLTSTQQHFPESTFDGFTYLQTLEAIRKLINPQYEAIRQELETLKRDRFRINTELETLQVELENIIQDIKNKEEEIVNQKQEKEALLRETYELFQRRLVEEVALHPDKFSVWFKQCLDQATERLRKYQENWSFIEQKIQREKASLTQKWNEAIHQACLAFNVSYLNLSVFDEYGQFILTNLTSSFNIDLHTLTIKEHLLNEIKKLDENLKETCSHFIADSSAFIGIISEELRTFRRTVDKYNQLASVARFGTLGRIFFELEYKKQYKALKEFQLRLEQAEQDNELQQVIAEVVRDKNQSLVKYFSQQVLNDPHAKTESFLDIYEYFDFEVYSEGSSGSRRSALRGSGGESTGMKYLIYSLAFHSLRIKGTSPGPITYAKPLFMFFDEAAAVDEKGIMTLTELSKTLKINAIIAMVTAPLIHDKRLSDYILANGIITPGYSDIVTTIDMGQTA